MESLENSGDRIRARILELSESEEGRKEIRRFMLKTMAAYSAQEVIDRLVNLGILNRRISATDMQEICLVIHDCLTKAGTGEILNYAEQVLAMDRDILLTMNPEAAMEM
jgi:hypothetical protein